MADENTGETQVETEDTKTENVEENEVTDQAQSADEQNESGTAGEKIFSQADLDRILAGRLAKYGDYDSIKQELAQFKQAAMTEQERAVESARTEATNEATARANERIVKSEARAAAAEAGFENPSLAIRLADLSGVSVDDEGEVDSAALRAALDAVATEAPGLLKSKRPGGLRSQEAASGSTGVERSAEEAARRMLGL